MKLQSAEVSKLQFVPFSGTKRNNVLVCLILSMMGLAFQLTQLLIHLLLQCFILAAADSKGKDRTGGFIQKSPRRFLSYCVLHCFSLTKAAVGVTEPLMLQAGDACGQRGGKLWNSR